MKNEKQKTSVFGRSDQNDLKEWGRERGGMAGKGWSWLGHAGVVSTYPLHTHTHIHKKRKKKKKKRNVTRMSRWILPCPPSSLLLSLLPLSTQLNSRREMEKSDLNRSPRFKWVADIVFLAPGFRDEIVPSPPFSTTFRPLVFYGHLLLWLLKWIFNRGRVGGPLSAKVRRWGKRGQRNVLFRCCITKRFKERKTKRKEPGTSIFVVEDGTR